MEIKLRKPIEKDGKSIETITLNLEGLKGIDLIQAEREARMRGDISPNPLFSSEGLAVVAAKASGLIADDILGLSAPDFLYVVNTVQNFLYDWVLPGNDQSAMTSEKTA